MKRSSDRPDERSAIRPVRSALLMVACLVAVPAATACGSDGGSDASDDTTVIAAEPSVSTTTQEPPSTTTTASPDPSTSTTQAPPSTTTTLDGSIPIGGGGVIGSLQIEVTHPDRDPVTYEVGCLDDAFPVTPEVNGVDGRAGCALLEDPAVFERLVDGAPADRVCTEIYGGPDVAHIKGEIDGQPVDTVVDRTNGCGIADWESLVPLLPPAVGVTS